MTEEMFIMRTVYRLNPIILTMHCCSIFIHQQACYLSVEWVRLFKPR